MNFNHIVIAFLLEFAKNELELDQEEAVVSKERGFLLISTELAILLSGMKSFQEIINSQKMNGYKEEKNKRTFKLFDSAAERLAFVMQNPEYKVSDNFSSTKKKVGNHT